MIDQADAPAATPPTTLKLGELLAMLIEAGISFDFAYRVEGKPGKHYMSEVSEQRAFGDDPVTTLLEAVARGVRTEAEADRTAREMLERNAARIAKINALLPGLHAHVPDAGELCSCGLKRGHPVGLFQLLQAASVPGVEDDGEPRPEPGKKKAH